jgi:hypothetical protein
MKKDDFLTATEIMRREMENMNRLKNITDPYGLQNQASMLTATSSAQNFLQSDSYKFIQESMRAQEFLRISDCNSQIGSVAQRAMESINLQNIAKDSIALNKLNQPDFFGDIQRQIGSSITSSLQTTMDKIKTSISVSTAGTLRILDGIPKSIAQQSASSILGLNSIQESIGIRMSAVQQAMQTFNQMKLFADTEAITKVFNQMQSSGVLEKALSALNTDHLFAQAIESFNSASYLSDYDAIVSDFELSESISLIKNADDKPFFETFRKNHPTVYLIIVCIFWQIFLSQINSIISAKATMPLVDWVLKSGKVGTEQGSVNLAPLSGIDISNLRFITRTGQKLRDKPSTRSEVLDELKNGQIFQVIQTKKGWVEINYPCADEQVCSGWVLSTYTEKFKYRAKNHR